MDFAAFTEYAADSDGWESDDDDEGVESLLYEDFKALPCEWKETLKL